MSAAIWSEPPARETRMTIRVSRDSGRTYGPTTKVRTGDDVPPPMTSTWPPCECPRHRQTATEDR